MKKREQGPIKRIWNFLWHEESFASYAILIVLAFIIIKYLVYPGIGIVTGTKLPVVAVVSGSMEHDQPFEEWWLIHKNFYDGFSITEEHFQNYTFKNGFDKGDIIILMGAKPESIKVGDVIVYQSMKPYPIIHRVIENDNIGQKFQTKGDHNLAQIVAPDLNEQKVQYSQLIGKAVIRVPYLGYVKIVFVEGLGKIGIRVSG